MASVIGWRRKRSIPPRASLPSLPAAPDSERGFTSRHEPAGTSSTTAVAAIPSPRPGNPSPFELVPRTFTRSGGTSRNSAILSRMASRYGAIFGASAMTTASTFPTQSAPPRRVADAGEQLAAVRPLQRRVRVREKLADGGEPGGAEDRVGDRVQEGVSVRVSLQSRRVWDLDPSETQGAPRRERVRVEADSDAAAAHAVCSSLSARPGSPPRARGPPALSP